MPEIALNYGDPNTIMTAHHLAKMIYESLPSDVRYGWTARWIEQLRENSKWLEGKID